MNNSQAGDISEDVKKLIVSCLDFTSLNDTDTEDNIRTLCDQAITPLGNVAAVCVAPQFVNLAFRQLQNTTIKIATVINFPSGTDSETTIIENTQKALFDGANEIDVVWPYQAYLQGNRDAGISLVRTVKNICADRIVKVILETSILPNSEVIASVSQDALQAGANFLKTSTGKVPGGATLEAAIIMLQAIKDYQPKTSHILGFKASGGIRTAKDAAQYLELAQNLMGKNWITPDTFRIGASSLLNNLLANTTGHTSY